VVACRPPRRDSVEHALYAYVFLNLRPAYPRTAAYDLEFCTLLCSRLGESPGPGQRNTNRPAVRQLGSNRLVSYRDTLNTSFHSSTPIAEELDLIPHTPHGRCRAKMQDAAQLLAN